MENELTTVGFWSSESKFDTLYLNKNPIINKIKGEKVKIYVDNKGSYHLQYIYEDGSYFPRKLFGEKKGRLSFFDNSESYYEIKENGDLCFVNHQGKKLIFRAFRKK